MLAKVLLFAAGFIAGCFVAALMAVAGKDDR